MDELELYKRAFPTCEEHTPAGGTRGGCLICAIQKLYYTLSRIDYELGEPNEFEMSLFDTDYDEDALLERVKAYKRRLNAASS